MTNENKILSAEEIEEIITKNISIKHDGVYGLTQASEKLHEAIMERHQQGVLFICA